MEISKNETLQILKNYKLVQKERELNVKVDE